MLAETEINLVNGVAALALGFGLLVLVAWVDRRYLQKYEEVQAAVEEKRNRAEKPLIDEAVTEENEVPSAAVAVVTSRTSDGIPWKGSTAAKRVQPLETVLPARRAEPEPVTVNEAKSATTASTEHRAEPMPSAGAKTSDTESVTTDSSTDDGLPGDDPADADVKAEIAEIDLRRQPDHDDPPKAAQPAQDEPPPQKVLPKGAEAALASILEVVPDPRNTIALTTDPTAEVRLTKTENDGTIASSGQRRATYEPPAPTGEEWDTPKEPAASDRLAASPRPAHHG
ncbi:MAG: hypothetical protein HYX32_08120 [Actinobacteria bacterium]|nr:hypothetical protein [Actinomycetota bacterium]